MTEYVQVVLIANVFRIVCLVVGLGFAYLGYRLYAIGVFEKAQEIKAAFGNANISLKQVAPGVVFGVSGIIIALLSVVRPITVDRATFSNPTGNAATASGQPTPSDHDSLAKVIEQLQHLVEMVPTSQRVLK